MFNLLKNFIQLIYNRYRFPTIYLELGAKVSMNSIIGKNVKIYTRTHIASCIIGDYTYITTGSAISDTTIGKFCSIGPDIFCNVGKHPTNLVSTYPGFYSKKSSVSTYFGSDYIFEEKSKVIIGSDVWIGARVIILSGIEIGHGAIVGAGSIVTKNVAPYSIVVGSPAKLIKYRFSENVITELLKSKWWEMSEVQLRKISTSMNDVDKFLNEIRLFK